jgi:hypothetical protein
MIFVPFGPDAQLITVSWFRTLDLQEDRLYRVVTGSSQG